MPNPALISCIPKMSSKLIDKEGVLSRLGHKIMLEKARFNYKKIKPFLRGKIIDVGSGAGTLLYLLKRNGFKAQGVDVKDLSIYSDIQPIIYDGKKLPFKKNHFDTALLICVLHHCGKNNLKVLKEVKRVAKRVVLLEDTYRSLLERLIVNFSDGLTNGEVYWHPYLKAGEWNKFVKKQGWKIVHAEEFSKISFGLFYGRYYLLVIE